MSYPKESYSSALSLDGVMHLIDSIREGRIWCPETDRTAHLRWVDSAYEEIPDGYDILTLEDFIMTYESIGTGFRVDREKGAIVLAPGLVLRLREARLVMDLDIGLCEEMLGAMQSSGRMLP